MIEITNYVTKLDIYLNTDTSNLLLAFISSLYIIDIIQNNKPFNIVFRDYLIRKKILF